MPVPPGRERCGCPAPGPLRVHVDASEPALVNGLNSKLRQAGFGVTPNPEPLPQTVIVTAAGTVGEAIDLCADPTDASTSRLLVVDTFGGGELRRALRAGVRVMLRSTEASSFHLATAVRTAHQGDCSLPHEALLGLLAENEIWQAGPAARTPIVADAVPVLTPRQTEMLALVAEGFDNASIARDLVVSEHTVKNVIYDLMSRMQARNRTHAAAKAVRSGLV